MTNSSWSWVVETFPQGAPNFVTHTMNARNNVLRYCIPNIMMPFLDEITMKGCLKGEKDVTLGTKGCKCFVFYHIIDCDKIVQSLEGVTFSG